MDQRLKDAGFRFAFSPIRVKFRPTAKDLQLCEESGRELALAIKRKLKAKEASVSSLGEDGTTTTTMGGGVTNTCGHKGFFCPALSRLSAKG